MKIPSKINVMGRVVTIKKVKNWEGHKSTSETLAGRYYPDTQTIYINTSFSIQTQKHFLLHELNHVVLYITGINQNMSLDLEECIAQSFASFYSGLLK